MAFLVLNLTLIVLQASLNTSSLSSLLSTPDHRLTSLTTPVPDAQSNPLEGGMMVEEPYHTEAYNTPRLLNLDTQGAPRHFLGMGYRTSLPNLQPVATNIADHNPYPKKFDTMKVRSFINPFALLSSLTQVPLLGCRKGNVATHEGSRRQDGGGGGGAP